MQAEMTRTAAGRPTGAYRMDRRGIMAQGRQQSSASRQRCAMPSAPVAPAETPKAVCAQLEQLNRRLAAAHAEIRRYQTRLFACERQMAALRQENAELEAACAEAQEQAARTAEQLQAALGSGTQSGDPQGPPQPQPQAPEPESEAQPLPEQAQPQAAPACVPQPPAQPEWQPKTRLEHLSVELMNWFDDMMGA